MDIKMMNLAVRRALFDMGNRRRSGKRNGGRKVILLAFWLVVATTVSVGFLQDRHRSLAILAESKQEESPSSQQQNLTSRTPLPIPPLAEVPSPDASQQDILTTRDPMPSPSTEVSRPVTTAIKASATSSSQADSTSLIDTSKGTTEASVPSQQEEECPPGQQQLKLYPPALLSTLTNKTTLLCGHLFRPLEFFEFGAGRPFLEGSRRQGMHYWAAGIGMHPFTFEFSNGSRHTVIFNAIMKCGSTSINYAFNKYWKSSNFVSDKEEKVSNSTRRNNETDMEGISSTRLVTFNYFGMLRNVEANMNFSKRLFYAQEQQRFPSTRAVLPSTMGTTDKAESLEYFANVRDPVSRFVSSTGQEMYIHHSRVPRLRKSCLKETAEETLRCSLNFVKRRFKGVVREPHFIPMAVVLLVRSYGLNTEIKLFDMSFVSHIVDHISSASKTAVESTTPQMRNAHNGDGKDQNSDVLKNMSVKDLTEDMVKEICDLYRVDVVMLESLGIPSRCSTLVPSVP